MPHRILVYLTFLKSVTVDWKILLGSITFAIAWPHFELIARFFTPIVGGIIWVFLKPKVIELKEKYKGMSKMQIIMDVLVSIKNFIFKIFK